MSNVAVPPSEPGRPAIRAIPMAGMASSLPQPLTSFVGRERETEEVGSLLARVDVRLLTLTGPGGIGKTRLALRVAQRVGDANGLVWFVALAHVREPELVAPTVAGALGIVWDTSRSLGQEVARLIRNDRVLLILDNFEQVLDTATLVTDLLTACPTLTVLATSRTPLRISGERLYAVPPLTLTVDGDAFDALGHADAVALFVDRANALAPRFELTNDNVEAVAEICRKLDGLPLAIELAAARVVAFSPATIRDRLGARLSLLAEGPRDQPKRLRSVRGSIAWSHELLNEGERVLFRRLAVFEGSWTLEAAEAVAGGGIDPSMSVFEGVASLVNGSLVRKVDGSGGETRYAMLETIREFAGEQLAESGEETAVRDRHAAWYLVVAEQADWSWFMPVSEGEAHLAQLESEQANIRGALTWFQQSGDGTSVLRMAGCLGALWVVRGRSREGQRWLQEGLAMAGPVPSLVRARAMAVLSWTLNTRGDPSRAVEIAESALDALRRHPPSMELVRGLILVGDPAFKLGRFDYAERHFEEAFAVLRSLDDAPWRDNVGITIRTELAMTALMRGDLATSEVQTQSALKLQAEAGHADGNSHIYGHAILVLLGDQARARGDVAEALRLYQRAIKLGSLHHNTRAVAYALGGVAGALAVTGNVADASRLFGACEAFNEILGFQFGQDVFDRQRALGLPEPWARERDACGSWQGLCCAVRARHPISLPPIADVRGAGKAWRSGRRLALDEAVALALSVTDTDVGTSTTATGLTPREREILRYLAYGRTDQQIADLLYLSRRTVNAHVAHILTKLDVSSRHEAVDRAHELGLLTSDA